MESLYSVRYPVTHWGYTQNSVPELLYSQDLPCGGTLTFPFLSPTPSLLLPLSSSTV